MMDDSIHVDSALRTPSWKTVVCHGCADGEMSHVLQDRDKVRSPRPPVASTGSVGVIQVTGSVHNSTAAD
jgi:hypothetical protein